MTNVNPVVVDAALSQISDGDSSVSLRQSNTEDDLYEIVGLDVTSPTYTAIYPSEVYTTAILTNLVKPLNMIDFHRSQSSEMLVISLIERLTMLEKQVSELSAKNNSAIQLSRSDARKKILALHRSKPGQVLYPADIAGALGIEMMMVADIQEELIRDGELVEDE